EYILDIKDVHPLQQVLRLLVDVAVNIKGAQINELKKTDRKAAARAVMDVYEQYYDKENIMFSMEGRDWEENETFRLLTRASILIGHPPDKNFSRWFNEFNYNAAHKPVDEANRNNANKVYSDLLVRHIHPQQKEDFNAASPRQMYDIRKVPSYDDIRSYEHPEKQYFVSRYYPSRKADDD